MEQVRSILVEATLELVLEGMMKEILARLDKIIELLELRNSIERARDEMALGIYVDGDNVFPPADRHGTAVDPDYGCACGGTAVFNGEYCPIHRSVVVRM